MAIRLTESRLRQIIREEMEELASTGMRETDIEEMDELDEYDSMPGWSKDDDDDKPYGGSYYPPENRSDGRMSYGAGSGDRSANVPLDYGRDSEEPFGNRYENYNRTRRRRT